LRAGETIPPRTRHRYGGAAILQHLAVGPIAVRRCWLILAAMSEEMPEFVIREGRADEGDDLLRFWVQAGAMRSSTDDLASVEHVVRHPTSRVLVTEEGGRLVGSLIVGWDGWRGAMYRLVVDPGRRRLGIATALVRRGEDHLRELGAVRVAALVMEGEEHAEAFWSSMGYAPHPGDRRFVRMLSR
jgi:ribosomal protein S18 acetylase RimI-like enzyme